MQQAREQWLVFLLSSLSQLPSQPIGEPAFQFAFTAEATTHNTEVLRQHQFDLAKAILSQLHSPLGYGSEFRQVDILEVLCRDHPLWPRLKRYIVEGVSYQTAVVDEQIRKSNLKAAIKRGNHASANLHPDEIHKLMMKDVGHGFVLPLSLEGINNLRGAELAPLGVAKQFSIDENGEQIPKFRATHDQSFAPLQGDSVNERIDRTSLLDCNYGFTLQRLIHAVLVLRHRHPLSPILISKVDLDSAYRRMHCSPDLASQSGFMFDSFTGVYLRLSFGHSGHPSAFSTFSEMVCDLANNLLQCRCWNVNDLHPHTVSIDPTPLLSANNTPAPALPLCVHPSVPSAGIVDVFLDDLITVGIPSPTPDSAARLAYAVPVVIEAIARPVRKDEPLPRSILVSTKKLQAEGQPSESKLVLGWLLDTRALTLALPSRKYTAWCAEIDDALSSKRISGGKVESLIGKLNHVAMIVPITMAFLGQLRHTERIAKARGFASLSDLARDDLKFWKIILRRAASGISLNLLSMREPTHHYRGDACDFGLGGLSRRGRAWRYQLPLELVGRASINLLEFLASVIGPWIDALEGNLPPLSCCLCEGDNVAAMRWLTHGQFAKEEHPAHHQVAKKIASVMMDSNSTLHPQYFPGVSNIVSDCLSRDFDCSDKLLTKFLFHFHPDQMPRDFNIAPLPNEIICWLTSVLRLLPGKMPSSRERIRSTTLHGIVGHNSVQQWDWDMTFSSTACPSTTGSTSCSPLPTQSTAVDSAVHTWLDPFRAAVSKRPSRTFQRPSAFITAPTQPWTNLESLRSFYSVNGEHIPMPTGFENTKKQSHSPSSVASGN